MAVETVVTILETAVSGGGAQGVMGGGAQSLLMDRVLWLRWWASDPKHLAFVKHEHALSFFNNIHSRTNAALARIKHLRVMNPVYLDKLMQTMRGYFAFDAAVARMAAEEAVVSHSARMATLNAAAASRGTLVAGAGTTVAVVVVPVVAMIAVQMALGAGLYQARQLVKKQGYASGFARGFITGLLNWELRFTIDRFWDNAVEPSGFDESLPKYRAKSHNEALIQGRLAGLAKPDDEKKDYLTGLRKLTHASTTGWTPKSDDWMDRMQARQVQISYVIDLAAAATKHKIVGEE